MKGKQSLQIKDLVKLTGVSRETLRFYETKGLVPKPNRNLSGYRQFPLETINRVKFIRLAQSAGFSLKEIQEIFNWRKRKTLSKAELKEIAKAKIKDLDGKIEALNQMKASVLEYINPVKNHCREEECTVINSTFEL